MPSYFVQMLGLDSIRTRGFKLNLMYEFCQNKLVEAYGCEWGGRRNV